MWPEHDLFVWWWRSDASLPKHKMRSFRTDCLLGCDSMPALPLGPAIYPSLQRSEQFQQIQAGSNGESLNLIPGLIFRYLRSIGPGVSG